MGGHGSPYPEEKAAPVSPQQQVHPAHFAPYADADLRDQHLPYADEQKHHGYSHSRSHSHSQSQPQHPQYQQPHPQQHQHQQPRSPPSTRPTTQFPSAITIPPIPTDPQTSLDAKHHTTPRTPTYTPHSPFGPNSTLPSTFPPPPNAHLPGQIPHPNASASPTWSSSLLTCDTLCLHALFSPCTLYSLTSHRLAQKRAHKDPTNLLSHSACDGNAWFYGLTCGLCGVLACLERGRVRRGYGIRGGMLGDALRGCCCACCVVGQAEREVRGREERWRANEGPGSGAGGYVMEGGMRYEPPPRG
ncbi:MAG: hypothetical protein MMC23_003468 [Stictis urceolatum]|nr:hypothetical protein [Stictis urceolata]